MLFIPDQGECAVCSPPQAVAQVMIQSFQLSSCALFNAQMQDVSHPHPPCFSISSSYLDVCKVTGRFVLMPLYFKNDTCEHGRLCFLECCSHRCVCAVVLSSSPEQCTSSTNPQLFHVECVSFVWNFYCISPFESD